LTFRTVVAIAVLAVSAQAYAQTPTGGISGTVTDATGAVIRGAAVSIVNTDTRQLRTLATSDDGRFTAAALSPGSYQIAIESFGFKRLDRAVTVEAGTTTLIDVRVELGEVTQSVTVSRPASLIRRDHHQVGGMVTREQIDRIPLNGRSILELAKLEPGVMPTRLTDGRVFVSVLGAGLQTIPRVGSTRVTVDGVNITTPGTAGVLLQVSPDVVQEFQIATVNFDAATSLTSNGAINIVTRSGTNAYHGSGFDFYRDDRLAAYPGLRRDPHNPDPAFRRHQFGVASGGPVRKDRLFFFASIERTDQTGVVSIQPLDEFASFGGLFRSPYAGTQVNVRVDGQLSHGHTVFARYTSDRNTGFTSMGAGSLPSSWSLRVNDTRQSLVGMTNVLSSHVVHEVRASHFPFSTSTTSVTTQQCPGCFGLGEIRTVVAGADLVFGGQGTSLASSGSRLQLTDALTWQIGSHTLRSGFEWEHNEASAFNFGAQSGEITLFSPREARQTVPGLPLPAAFATPADFLSLPLKQFTIAVGSGTVLWEGFRPERVTDLYRLHLADTWRATDRITLNAGLGWSYEPNAISQDLTKPALLAPIVGAGGLKPPKPETANVSIAGGVAWAATADGRTLLRAGGGRYFDPAGSTNTFNRAREREFLSPLGTATLMETGSNLVVDGHVLQFQQPTFFTGTDLIAVIPSVRETLLRSLNPENRDLSIRNLDLTKRGNNLVDPAYTTPSSLHLSAGVQREVAPGLLVSADVAWKRFRNTFINGIDYNRWNSAGGPVIPRCIGPQRTDVRALCSNGPMFFDTASGRARYRGLLLRAEKRFSGRAQLLASYALSSFVGSNGTGTGTSENPGGRVFGFNNDNWLENYGPLPSDQRHVLNVSGAIELPFDIALAVSISAYSAPPFAPYVANVDFNGDGTVNDLLPGTTVNQFGSDRGKDELITLVKQYNEHVAGTTTAGGQIAQVIQLPETFSFNDSFFTQDLRLIRRIRLGTARRQVEVSVDVFNLFNTANLVGVGSDLTQPASFGQPSDRVGQVFGSGGSRAIQLGVRLQF
jgi:hypothetical protein